MAFPDSVVDQAWNRSDGKCECTRTGHSHNRPCNKDLFKAAREKETPLGWETHHIIAGGPDTLSNCEILCQNCHKQTDTYGG